VIQTTPWQGWPHTRSAAANPAVEISWHDVQHLIHTLNQAAKDSVYRLPTEAEWEYACRAGTTERWSFGDDEAQLGDYAWYFDNAEDYAHAVGTRRPNPWGLYDMHGNVYEWVQDRWGSYPSGVQTNPVGPSAGSSRVFRGGDFSRGAQNARSAYRGGYSPDNHSIYVGARLLRTQ
jgi:formylglycine-generating enzyme required for sulfatase activity